VSLVVVTSGSGQLLGPANLNSGPCRAGRPVRPGGGAGNGRTRPERNRPNN